ncbi:hypothetical protein [Achromobacter spanius]|uniref:hypothetical protein n=1 Tax=Achromobacter spanius TaxID=217203 RepID=UPI003F68DF5B
MTTQTANIQALRAPAESSMPPVVAGFFDLAGFELLQRVAKAFSSSTLVPQQYQNNVANSMIALNLARRLRADELMVMQNLYIVHGNPGWSSKFLIASVNTCGRFETLRYEWRGKLDAEDYGCRAWTIEKSTGEKLYGTWIDWKMVKAEGWNKKSGSKWLTMPDQMFIYRAAAFWQRAYAPEISMGLATQEELIDTLEARTGPDGTISVNVDELRGTQANAPATSRRQSANVADVDPETGEVLDAFPAKAHADASDSAHDAATATSAASNPAAEGGAKSAEPTDRSQDDDAPEVAPAKVEERLRAAKDIEVLDVAADFIRDVADDDERERLTQIYQQLRLSMTSAQQRTQRRRVAAPE